MSRNTGNGSPGIGQAGQPHHVGAQLLEGGLADAVLLGLLGVVAALVRCHQHLSLHRGIAHTGLLYSTVSEGAGVPARRGSARTWLTGAARRPVGITPGRPRQERGWQPSAAVPVSGGRGAEPNWAGGMPRARQ